MKRSKIHIISLYFIILILIWFIIFFNKNIILNSNKIILKNMDETTEVSDLNKTIETLNTSHTEYANYIQISKVNLATAITNAGINTDSNADFETMITNVSNIFTNKTDDATAAASEILSGKTAYVKGNKIIGTIENRGVLDWNPSTSTSYSLPEGYYSGGTISTTNAYNAGVNSKTTTIVNLGSPVQSTTIDIKSKYSGYANLTANNFIGAFSLALIAQCTDQGNIYTTLTRTLSYNATTGILTVTCNNPGTPIHGTNHIYMGSSTSPIYLVY